MRPVAVHRAQDLASPALAFATVKQSEERLVTELKQSDEMLFTVLARAAVRRDAELSAQGPPTRHGRLQR